MRPLLLMLGILLGATWFGTPAQAQNYPWCAALNLGDLAYNCGFDTEAQCRATVSGIGGFCERNTQYVPAARAPASIPGQMPRAQSSYSH